MIGLDEGAAAGEELLADLLAEVARGRPDPWVLTRHADTTGDTTDGDRAGDGTTEDGTDQRGGGNSGADESEDQRAAQPSRNRAKGVGEAGGERSAGTGAGGRHAPDGRHDRSAAAPVDVEVQVQPAGRPVQGLDAALQDLHVDGGQPGLVAQVVDLTCGDVGVDGQLRHVAAGVVGLIAQVLDRSGNGPGGHRGGLALGDVVADLELEVDRHATTISQRPTASRLRSARPPAAVNACT